MGNCKNKRPVTALLAPIVNLPAGRAVLASSFGDHDPVHHALRHDTRSLCLRAPKTATRSLDHIKPGTSNPQRAVQMDAHFAVSLQIQHLHATCAWRMKASVQKWQEGIGGALKTAKALTTDQTAPRATTIELQDESASPF